MLFHIDDSVRILAQSDAPPQFLADFTEELFRARRVGRHIIYAAPATLDALATLAGLSARAIQTIKKIKSRVRAKKALYDSIPIHVRVVADSGIFQKIQIGSKMIIEISADALAEDSFFRETILLVENESDGEFYTILSKLYQSIQAPSQNLRLTPSIFPGGGSQTPRLYEKLKKDRAQFVLCIVDGDLEYGGAPLGSNTAQPIHDSDAKNPPILTHSVIIECYSIENLIPPTLMEKAAGLNGTVPIWLGQLHQYSDLDFWPYLALKKKHECSMHRAGDARAVYWGNKFSQIVPPNIKCSNWGKWEACNDSCSAFDGLSKKTLDNVIAHMQTIEKQGRTAELIKIASQLPQPISSLWRSVAESVISWTCSGDRVLAA